jgi:hypothetical protein
MQVEEIVSAIIKEQSQIVGDSLAKQMALDSGVVIFKSQKIDDITVSTLEPSIALSKLIVSYGKLFGPASVEVCKNIVKKYYGAADTSFLQSLAV